MFGFIYQTFNPERWLFYDWNKNNLRYCSNPKEAEQRRNQREYNMREVSVKLYGSKSMKVKIPVVADWEESHNIANYVDANKINTINAQLIAQILNEFCCTEEWTFYHRAIKRESRVDWVLMHMRDIIEWIFRVSPLKVVTWEDKNTKEKEYLEIPIWQTVKTKYKASDTSEWVSVLLQWIYASSIRKMMFPDSDFDWNTLQSWQRDALYKRWQYTFMIASRESGKSILSAGFVATFILKELCMPKQELLRWVQILYYWQSNDSNKRYYKYVKWLLKKLFKDSKYVRFSDTNMVISIDDWDVSREIQFISQLSEAKGRWERPSLVIIDEAARVDEEVWKIALGTTWIPIICVSTVNYETRKNWFYDEFVRAEKQQRSYEPIDDLIVRIFFKYNLWWDVQENIDKDNYAKARDEFYTARERVALRYSIDDIEPSLISEWQKALKIDNASQQWEKFVMAEYYGYYVDDVEVFSYDWLIAKDTPRMFDFITIWFDPAQDFDFPWCTVVWVKDNLCYILESKRLSSDPIVQLRELKEMRDKYKWYVSWDRKYVNVWADVTRWDAELQVIEDKWVFVDYPIRFTPSKWISYSWRIHKPWKLYIIEDVIRKEFFQKDNIRFTEWCNQLLEELSCFKRVPTPSWWYTYKWVKSKDDLVFSMMIALYVAYVESLRDVYNKEYEEKTVRIWKLTDLVSSNDDSSFNDMVIYWN